MAFLVDVGCFQQARIRVHLLVHSTGSRLFAPGMAPVLPCASLAAFYSPPQAPVSISLSRQWSKVSRMPLVVVATLDAAAAGAGVGAAVVVVAAAVGDIDGFDTECYTDSVHIDSAEVDKKIVETAAVVDNVAAIGTVAVAAVDTEAVVQADTKSVEVAAAVDTATAAAVVGIVTVVDIAIVTDTARVADIEPVAEADTVTAVEVEGYTVVAAAVGTESAVTVVAVAAEAVAAAAEVVDWQSTLEMQKTQ